MSHTALFFSPFFSRRSERALFLSFFPSEEVFLPSTFFLLRSPVKKSGPFSFPFGRERSSFFFFSSYPAYLSEDDSSFPFSPQSRRIIILLSSSPPIWFGPPPFFADNKMKRMDFFPHLPFSEKNLSPPLSKSASFSLSPL